MNPHTSINYAKSMKKLMDETFVRYSGCLIEKSGSQFKVGERTYPTLEDAKYGIDKTFREWGNQIKQQNQKL